MKYLYYIALLIGAFVIIYFGVLKKEPLIPLFLFFVIYRPIVDAYFIRKMKLYDGKKLWKKYPFWSFTSKLLFKK